MYLKNKLTPICHDICTAYENTKFFITIWRKEYCVIKIIADVFGQWDIFIDCSAKNKEELKIMMSCISWLHPFVMRMYSVTNYSSNDDTAIVAMFVFWQKMMNWENYYLFLW